MCCAPCLLRNTYVGNGGIRPGGRSVDPLAWRPVRGPLAWRLVRGAGWGETQKREEEEREREKEVEEDEENWEESGEAPQRVDRA